MLTFMLNAIIVTLCDSQNYKEMVYKYIHGKIIALLVFAALIFVMTGSNGDIYKYVDSNGIPEFTDRQINNNYRLIYKTANKPNDIKAHIDTKAFKLNRRRYTPMIDQLALRHGLDANLVHAVVTMESAYDPRATSSKGAVGLMQLMPGTAERYGVYDREDPEDNLSGGVRYLKDLLKQFQSLHLALAAYNAGEGAVQKYGNKIPPYPETQNYVRKVIQHYKKLKS